MKCPEYLSDRAKEIWREFVEKTKPDSPLLEAFCNSKEIYEEASKNIAEHGAVVRDSKGDPIANPYLSILNKQSSNIAVLSRQLGLGKKKKDEAEPDKSCFKKDLSRCATWTAEKREKFFEVLSETGNISLSVRACGVSRMRAYDLRESDPDFAEKWDEAKKTATEMLEGEAWRRAVEGVEEPVGWHQGEAGGVIKRYSDNLLMFLLKGESPDKYAERSRITHSVDDTLAERMTRARERIKELPEDSGNE